MYIIFSLKLRIFVKHVQVVQEHEKDYEAMRNNIISEIRKDMAPALGKMLGVDTQEAEAR